MSLELAKYSWKVDEELEAIDMAGLKTQNTKIDGRHLNDALQQIFPSLADPEEDELRMLMEEYIKYKKSYVTHLQFQADLQNLSKF